MINTITQDTKHIEFLKTLIDYNNSAEAEQLRNLVNLEKTSDILSEKLKTVDWNDIAKVERLYTVDRVELENTFNLHKKTEDELVIKYKELSSNLIEKGYVKVFYEGLLDKLTVEYLESLSNTLTEVYTSVYKDESKRIVLTMDDKRNKKVITLNIVKSVEGKKYLEKLSDDGGSASIILGTVIAVYFIVVSGLPRIMFFDESLASLHNETLDEFLPFLKSFVDKMGFKFIIIAHDYYRMKNFIDKAYLVESGVYTLVDNLHEFLNSNYSTDI